MGKESGRDDWMIFRVPGLRSYDSATPTPFPPLPSANCLSFSVFLCVAGRAYCRERGGGGVWAWSQITKPYDHKKAWPSINHSVLSVRGLRRELCFRSAVLYGMFISATWTRAPPPLSPCPACPASLNSQPSRYGCHTICALHSGTESRGAKIKLAPGASPEITNCCSGVRAEITNFGPRSLLFTTALRKFYR